MFPRLLKLLKVALLIALASIVTLFLFLCLERVRGKVSLANYKKQLKAKGEALIPSDLTLPSVEGPNGAPEIMQASHELISGPVLPNHSPPRMKMSPSSGAIIGFHQQDWTEEKDTYSWGQLADDLKTNRAALDRIRAGLARPVLDNKVDHSGGAKMLFPQLVVAKKLTYWFGSDCQLALHENRLDDALSDLLTQISLPRFLERDRILISELVRFALASIARADTWEALQADGWTDAQLAQLQQAWQERNFIPGLAMALDGERVYVATMFDECRKSNDEAFSMIFWMDTLSDVSERPGWELNLRAFTGDGFTTFLKKQVYCRLWRFAWLDQCNAHYLHLVQHPLELAREAVQTKSWNQTRSKVDFWDQMGQNKSLYDKLRYPIGAEAVGSLSHAIRNALRVETERSLVLSAIALKRYSLKNPTPPVSVEALVPSSLAPLPIDYMDGKPVKYNLNKEGQPVLYSVGDDGIDDGGDTTPTDHLARTGNWWARKDVVWPSAILP